MIGEGAVSAVRGLGTRLGALGIFRARAHVAAPLALGVALAVAFFVFGMPVVVGLSAAALGAAYGLFPIGWIVFNLIFLYDLTAARGHLAVLRASLARLSPDLRIQVIGTAFCLGAFFEGAAGFGTPVAFGALGTPILALQGVEEAVFTLNWLSATGTGILAAAHSSGGVMGKRVDAQSIVVASVATGAHGHEGQILRRVFWHSLALAALGGPLVSLQAYAWPFTRMVCR